MNKFLSSASERYPKELLKSLIAPISRVDAQIIFILIEILKKTPFNKLYSILDSYKYLKDNEIFTQLEEYSSSFSITKDESSEEKDKSIFLFKRNFIYFKDLRLDLSLIKCYEKCDDYSYVSGKFEYKIIINRLPETTTVIGISTHKVIKYDNMEIRDRDFEALDSFISNFEGIEFINKK